MSQLKFVLLSSAALAAASSPVWAQNAPAPAPVQAPASTPKPAQEDTAQVGEVVVSARTNSIRTSIDAISYSLADDIQATTGALADALRNLPSVDVDPDGNVSLRGDSGVTILVDGRPAAIFTGESRKQAVLSTPAAQYSRIEVMTNPSAAYSPEGTGGIINLITKPVPVGTGGPSAAPKLTGSLQANAGDSGRYNLGLNLARTHDRLTLTLDAGLRHDPFEQTIDHVRSRYDATAGRFLDARQHQDIEGASDHAYVRLGAEYRLDNKTQLNGELRYTDIDVGNDGRNDYEADDALNGLSSAWRRTASGGYAGQFVGTTGRILRRFNDEGHEWSNELRLDRVRGDSSSNILVETTVPVLAPFYEAKTLVNNVDQLGFTSAYTLPMSDGSKLRAGYDLRLVALDLNTSTATGPDLGSLVPNPLVSNDFHIDEAVHALYATWEKPLNEKLSGQLGLRLEQVDRELDQVTSGDKRSTSDFNAYPTLHLQYTLSDSQTLRGSYSRRVQRPRPSELNPFLTYIDPLNYISGNPDLRQQETDAFEVMWQRRIQQTFYQTTLYYRDTSDAFTMVSSDLGDGALLTRPENLGGRTDIGLEVVANGRLHSTLRYNASINLFRQEIDASNIAGGSSRTSDLVSGRLNLNWQPTSADFVQIATVWTGDQLLAQGTREGATLVNLGYRRKLTPQLALQISLRDVFDEGRSTTLLDTPAFRDRTETWSGGRTGLIGLTWAFGQTSRPQDPSFDFAAPQTGT